MEDEKGEEIKRNSSEEESNVERRELVGNELEEPQKEATNLEKKEEKKSKNKSLTDKIKAKIISFLKNKYNLAFLVVLFLALLIRLKYIGQESIWNDAAVHLWYTIKVTKEPLFFFSSGYLTGDYFTVQTLTAFVYLFTKNAFLAGKIVAILFGLTGIIFMYLLGSELKNKFTGLIAAALLGFHHLFWFYGVRLLADGPLVTMVVIVFYFFVKLEKENKIKWGIWFGVSVLLALSTKKQIVLLPIALMIYYLIHKRKEMFTNTAVLVSWLIAFGLPFLGGLFFTFIFDFNVFYSLTKRFIIAKGLSQGFTALNFFNHLFSWYVLVLMFIGALVLILYKQKEYTFFMYFFVVYWGYFEVVGGVLDRYLLPLLPVAIIFSAFTLDEVGVYIKMYSYAVLKLLLVGMVVSLLCLNFYNLGDNLIYHKSTSYAGHIEAGQWLKENVPEDAIIFAGSPRTVRAFAEREYAGPGNRDYGGNSLWYLRADEYLENKSTFEKDLETLLEKSDVYLEIDIWEYTQPSWYFPINQDSLDYFISLGFQLVKVVEREVNTQQGLQRMPVIFLFKKEKQTKDFQ